MRAETDIKFKRESKNYFLVQKLKQNKTKKIFNEFINWKMNFSQANDYKIFAQRNFDHLNINSEFIPNVLFNSETGYHSLGKDFFLIIKNN